MVVHPNEGGLSDVSRYTVYPLYCPEPTTRTLPKGLLVVEITVAPVVVAALATVVTSDAPSRPMTATVAMTDLRRAPTMLLESGCGSSNIAADIVIVVGAPAKGEATCRDGGTATPVAHPMRG